MSEARQGCLCVGRTIGAVLRFRGRPTIRMADPYFFTRDATKATHSSMSGSGRPSAAR